MADLFGAVAGSRLAAKDRQESQLAQLAMQKDQVTIMQGMMELNQQAKMLQNMGAGDGAPPTAEALATQMDRMAAAAAGAGLYDKADKFATTGSVIRKNQAEITNKQNEEIVTNLNLFSSLLDTVSSEEEWQQANQMFTQQTGKPSPWANTAYDPMLVGRLKVGIQSAKDRALIESRKAQTAAAKASEAERKERLPLIRAQTRVAQERAEALNKAGSTIKPPKAGQLRMITDLLTQDFGATLPPEDQRVVSRPVAERMVELLRAENLTETEAAHRAYNEAKQRGDFAGIRLRLPMPGTERRPLPIPDDKAKLKVNMFYEKGGEKFVWTGTGFRRAATITEAITDEEIEMDEELEDAE